VKELDEAISRDNIGFLSGNPPPLSPSFDKGGGIDYIREA
jgi:hypothetical protein